MTRSAMAKSTLKLTDEESASIWKNQRTIVPNKNRKILSQMNHLTKMVLGES
jgi:hypothetical protein